MLLGLCLNVTKLWLAYYIWRMETRGFPGSTLSSVMPTFCEVEACYRLIFLSYATMLLPGIK